MTVVTGYLIALVSMYVLYYVGYNFFYYYGQIKREKLNEKDR